jgi:hypothetical protein
VHGATSTGIAFTPTSTVRFNGIPAATITYISADEVEATVPAGATSGPITLTTSAGTVQARGSYTITTTKTSSNTRPTATLAIATPLAV